MSEIKRAIMEGKHPGAPTPPETEMTEEEVEATLDREFAEPETDDQEQPGTEPDGTSTAEVLRETRITMVAYRLTDISTLLDAPIEAATTTPRTNDPGSN